MTSVYFEQGQLRGRSTLHFTHLGGCALSEPADTGCRR
jgi:hypothetical protein